MNYCDFCRCAAHCAFPEHNKHLLLAIWVIIRFILIWCGAYPFIPVVLLKKSDGLVSVLNVKYRLQVQYRHSLPFIIFNVGMIVVLILYRYMSGEDSVGILELSYILGVVDWRASLRSF